MPIQKELTKNTQTQASGTLFMATVVSSDPGTMVIQVAPDGQSNLQKLQGVPLAHTFARALGFKETVLPQIGSKVLCYGGYSGSCIIIGQIPFVDMQVAKNVTVMPTKTAFGTDEPLLDPVHSTGYNQDFAKMTILHNQLPTDVVQGEKVIANEFGVMLGLFQLMATLKGSELAQIQCHFLDDLVRIISHNFQHYTALGEHSIFHDGKGLHLEIGMTHDPKESLGVQQNSGVVNKSSGIQDTGKNTQDTETDKGVNFYSITDERLKAIERLKLFIGKLGDFINLLIVRPANGHRALDGKPITEYDRGLLQFHAGLDGLLVVRSLKGIVLEKTNWIRVPTRVASPEDPEGDDAAKIEYPVRDDYVFDDTYANGNPFLYYLQLRDYLAYVEEDLGYSNFKAHKKDFQLNNDYSKETPLEGIVYVDPTTGASYQRKRSIVALMPNGGVSMSDAWSSAIVMEGGNIYIQPAKDLVLQPNRNLIAKVGDKIAVAARSDIDLSSTSGSLRTKTNLSQYMYAENGGIVLHADGIAGEEGYSPYDTQEPVRQVAGIVLKAPVGAVTSYGYQIYHNAVQSIVTNSDYLIDNIRNFGSIYAKKQLSIQAKSLNIMADSNLTCYSKGSGSFIGGTSTMVGKKGQYFGEVTFGGGGLPVEGLIDTKIQKNQDYFTQLDELIKQTNEKEISDYLMVFKKDENLEKLKFYFLSSDQYSLDKSEVIPQTMIQQDAANFPQLYSMQKWVETPVNDTYPYPGADLAYSYVRGNLDNLDASTGELVNKTEGFISEYALLPVVNVFKEYTVHR